MRSIKFRAWDKEDKKYLTEDCMPIVGSGCDKILSFGDSDYAIFEQYTGLKDKNGKEIFEGDICAITNTWNTFNREVIFKDAGFGFQGTIGMFIPLKEMMEIIGNIHENPELLNK